MRQFQEADLLTAPAMVLAYLKKTFLANAGAKWLPASLCAVFLNLQTVFSELFFIVLLLWACDFLIGIIHAWHDPALELQWITAFRSVLKVIVIGLGVVSVHFIEQLILQAGVDTQTKITSAVMVVIGVAESISILDNLVYFFPGLGELTARVKDLLTSATNGGGSNGS